MPDPKTFTPRSVRDYPNRPELDRANAAFRRTMARLARDKHPETARQASRFVREAVAALDALTDQAERVREQSPFHRGPKMSRMEARATAALRASVRRSEQRGEEPNPKVVKMLENGFLRPKNGPHGDDAA